MNTLQLPPDTDTDLGAPQPQLGGGEARQRALTAEIEQAIERLSVRYTADLRLVSEEMARYAGTARQRERDTTPALANGFQARQDTPATETGDDHPPFIDPRTTPQPGRRAAFAVPPQTVQPAPSPEQSRPGPARLAADTAPSSLKRSVLYQAETPRSARRPRKRLALFLTSIAALAVIGAGLGQGGMTPRDPDAVPTGVTGSSGARQGLIAAQQDQPSPTTGPAPSATVAQPSPTPAQRSAPAAHQQVADAEATLRTGQFEVLVNYGSTNRSSVQVRFDFGDRTRAPRLHLVTTYHAATASQIAEYIVIGDRVWQRQPNGQWVATANQDGFWEQVQAYLPQVRSSSNVVVDSSGNTMVLNWYDAGRNADLTLDIDPNTGVPRQLRQVTRATDLTLKVTYAGWNTPVDIVAPIAP